MRPAQLSVVGRPWHWTLSVIENVLTLEGPHHIMSHNLQLTSANTTKGIETCGVLCGKLMRNAFAITRSPPRPNSGLQDCHTENEKHFPQAGWLGLLTPGCLQTHTTQMAFYPVCTFTTLIKWCFQNPWQLSALPSSRKLDKWMLSVNSLQPSRDSMLPAERVSSLPQRPCLSCTSAPSLSKTELECGDHHRPSINSSHGAGRGLIG